MTSIDSLRGRTVLIVAHCAGMLDLVALALWVGALVTRYGFDPQQAGVRIVGVLPVFDVRVSGFLVHPVVAFAEREPKLEPDGYEVVEILTPPLATFLPGAPIDTVEDVRDGFQLRYGGYRVGRHLVWGATAMMLSRFGAYLGSAQGA